MADAVIVVVPRTRTELAMIGKMPIKEGTG